MAVCRSIILCGLPMSGKSYYGERLARKLGWPCIDIDRRVEEAYSQEEGKPLTSREIFLKEDEQKFWKRERALISSLKEGTPCVLVLGGGSLNDEETVEKVKSLGVVVYLHCDITTIFDRIATREILPAYANKEALMATFSGLVEQRRRNFQDHADISLDVSQADEEAVIETLSHLATEESESFCAEEEGVNDASKR